MAESKSDATKKSSPSSSQPVRLYVKGTVLGFQRGLRTQNNAISLIKLQGVEDKKATEFYLGKRLAFIYKAKTKKNGTQYRTIWGRVVRAHGSNGVVRARFRNCLPSAAMGAPVRCMLYPSRV